MMTILEQAKDGLITPLTRKLARQENVKAGDLVSLIAGGKVVVPVNARRAAMLKPCAVGQGLRTKVNANIGTSTDRPLLSRELAKLDMALRCGADAVMDLSVGGELDKIRLQIIRRCHVPLGTVPVYEISVRAYRQHQDFLSFNIDDILQVLEAQAREGVDFFTIHAGVTWKSMAALKSHQRLLGIVSRGGAIMAAWINRHKKENPFFEHYDAVLDIAYRYDVTLSLGDGLRPGSVLDATDAAQVAELKILAGLARRARQRNVQVMIEGPGHVPLNQVARNIRLQKRYCQGAPFYVLGPLVTDIAPGYDHITSAIGGAVAASEGADFLCYVTPAEHLRHPTIEDVKEGVMAARIAAHAADIVKSGNRALEWDRKMSLARRARDWKKQIALAIDPEKARQYRRSSKPQESSVCTMCGQLCSIKMFDECTR